MPCSSSDGMTMNNDYEAHRRIDQLERRLVTPPAISSPRDVEAMLCAICRVLGNDGALPVVLSRVDWKQAGVTFDDFARWYVAHQVQDQAKEAGP